MRDFEYFIWLLLGGAILGLAWFTAGVTMMLTLVGVPLARTCFAASRLILSQTHVAPASKRSFVELSNHRTGLIRWMQYALWITICGWWLVAFHLFLGLLLRLTLIGSSLALRHFKFARAAAFPSDIVLLELDKEGASDRKGGRPALKQHLGHRSNGEGKTHDPAARP